MAEGECPWLVVVLLQQSKTLSPPEHCDVPAQAPKQPKASIPMPAQGPLLPAKPPHPQAATSRAHRKGDGCYLESLRNEAPAPAEEWAVGNGCEDLQMSNTSREAERVR